MAQRAISETEDLVPAPPVEGAVEPGMHGSPAPKAERQAVLVGYGVKLGTTSRRAREDVGAGCGAGAVGWAHSAGRASRVGRATGGAERHSDGRVSRSANGVVRPAVALAKPPVRKMARDLGVDLAR